MSASTRRIAELETAQEAERDSLRRRHRIEIEKFHQWVEAEILAACYNAPPGPSDSIVRPERFALNSSVCEYLLKQRYGNDVFIDRSKHHMGDSEFVRNLLTQKNQLLHRHRLEADALRASQAIEWAQVTGENKDPKTFPLVEVEDLSLEDMAPRAEDL